MSEPCGKTEPHWEHGQCPGVVCQRERLVAGWCFSIDGDWWHPHEKLEIA